MLWVLYVILHRISIFSENTCKVIKHNTSAQHQEILHWQIYIYCIYWHIYKRALSNFFFKCFFHFTFSLIEFLNLFSYEFEWSLFHIVFAVDYPVALYNADWFELPAFPIPSFTLYLVRLIWFRTTLNYVCKSFGFQGIHSFHGEQEREWGREWEGECCQKLPTVLSFTGLSKFSYLR